MFVEKIPQIKKNTKEIQKKSFFDGWLFGDKICIKYLGKPQKRFILMAVPIRRGGVVKSRPLRKKQQCNAEYLISLVIKRNIGLLSLDNLGS